MGGPPLSAHVKQRTVSINTDEDINQNKCPISFDTPCSIWAITNISEISNDLLMNMYI